MNSKLPTNKLEKETSPYLKQHASNPVDWYPWGEEAFKKAQRENKPIFLSIGYSTCHWCHVMAHESFEDTEVAEALNRSFISIKVDREERPDIDSVYMKAAVLATGKGGWPLTIIMTPDKIPFFTATYIPKNSRYGMMGLTELLETLDRMWKSDRQKLLNSASSIKDALNSLSKSEVGDSIDEGMVDRAFHHFSTSFDEKWGGFGGAPKFPSPHNIIFLLRQWWRTGNKGSLKMATTSLKKMRYSGLYDHIGGGFHRYSTDVEWRLPHFEKMLYDQAMMALAYTEGYLATKDPIFKETVEGVLEYVQRDMTSSDGGFYSAENADSDGEEGKFYVWTEKEITSIFGRSNSEKFLKAFDIRKEGNFKDEATGKMDGKNVLYLQGDIYDPDLKKMLETLRSERDKRIRPSQDDKILTDWNSLMISAFSKAYQAFGRNIYLEIAQKAMERIKERSLSRDGAVMHLIKPNNKSVPGFLDDHSFLLNALLDLYESDLNPVHLEDAVKVAISMIGQFMDKDRSGFFLTSEDGEELLVREKEAYDGAMPSGNSIAMSSLIRLSRMTGETNFEEIASETGKNFTSDLQRAPWGFTQMLSAFMHGQGPSREIVISGELTDPLTEEMLGIVREAYLPNKVILLREPNDNRIEQISPFTKDNIQIDGKTTAYVCQGWKCDVPTNDPDRLRSFLARN